MSTSPTIASLLPPHHQLTRNSLELVGEFFLATGGGPPSDILCAHPQSFQREHLLMCPGRPLAGLLLAYLAFRARPITSGERAGWFRAEVVWGDKTGRPWVPESERYMADATGLTYEAVRGSLRYLQRRYLVHIETKDVGYTKRLFQMNWPVYGAAFQVARATPRAHR